MDCLTFTSNAIDSLAWPVTAILLVIILRKEIGKAVSNLKRLKAGPVEAEFERQVQELKDEVSDQPGISEDVTPESTSKPFLYQLAELHPRSAILESWVRVEAAARTVFTAKAPPANMRTYISAARLGKRLLGAEILSPEQELLYHKLRRLRNDLAHSQEVEPDLDSAQAYVDLAAHLQWSLESQLR